uniref:Uncharacterized protein n=1 Tax=Cacopsylla melanoneura TaxID=428564 RepID=A0A8D9B7Q3_9HEMI
MNSEQPSYLPLNQFPYLSVSLFQIFCDYNKMSTNQFPSLSSFCLSLFPSRHFSFKLSNTISASLSLSPLCLSPCLFLSFFLSLSLFFLSLPISLTSFLI